MVVNGLMRLKIFREQTELCRDISAWQQSSGCRVLWRHKMWLTVGPQCWYRFTVSVDWSEHCSAPMGQDVPFLQAERWSPGPGCPDHCNIATSWPQARSQSWSRRPSSAAASQGHKLSNFSSDGHLDNEVTRCKESRQFHSLKYQIPGYDKYISSYFQSIEINLLFKWFYHVLL